MGVLIPVSQTYALPTLTTDYRPALRQFLAASLPPEIRVSEVVSYIH